ncbi:MAG: aldehyde dehydrogenase family protein, partial [Pseudonocardia sp.]
GGGFFDAPWVFAFFRNNAGLARVVVFGPVIGVSPFDTAEVAIAIAHDSEYGLAGSVWTADEERGINMARRIRTGTIGVNYYHIDLAAPFGGMKQSGLGREGGPEALDGYLEYKSIYASASQLKG